MIEDRVNTYVDDSHREDEFFVEKLSWFYKIEW